RPSVHVCMMDCLESDAFPTRRSPDLCFRARASCWIPLRKQLQNGNGGEISHYNVLIVSPSSSRRSCHADSSSYSLEASRPRVGSDRKSTRLNSSHVSSSYAVFCLKKN